MCGTFTSISIHVYTIHVHMHVRATILEPLSYDHFSLVRSRQQVQYFFCVDEIYTHTCIPSQAYPFTCISIHSHMHVRATIFEQTITLVSWDLVEKIIDKYQCHGQKHRQILICNFISRQQPPMAFLSSSYLHLETERFFLSMMARRSNLATDSCQQQFFYYYFPWSISGTSSHDEMISFKRTAGQMYWDAKW